MEQEPRHRMICMPRLIPWNSPSPIHCRLPNLRLRTPRAATHATQTLAAVPSRRLASSPLASISLIMDPAVAAAGGHAEANGESGSFDDAAEFMDAVESGKDGAAAGVLILRNLHSQPEGSRRRRSDLRRRDVGIGGADAGGHRQEQHQQGDSGVRLQPGLDQQVPHGFVRRAHAHHALPGPGLHCSAHCRVRPRHTLRIFALLPEGILLGIREPSGSNYNEMVDMWKNKTMNTFGILYSWFLAKVASQLEVLLGSEIQVAFEEAISYGGKVIPGHRPVKCH